MNEKFSVTRLFVRIAVLGAVYNVLAYAAAFLTLGAIGAIVNFVKSRKK